MLETSIGKKGWIHYEKYQFGTEIVKIVKIMNNLIHIISEFHL